MACIGDPELMQPRGQRRCERTVATDVKSPARIVPRAAREDVRQQQRVLLRIKTPDAQYPQLWAVVVSRVVLGGQDVPPSRSDTRQTCIDLAAR